MFRKIFSPISNFFSKPYVARLRKSEPKFQEAVKSYHDGDLDKASSIFKQLVEENPADKASRGWIGRIDGEKKVEDKISSSSSNSKTK